MERMRNGQTVAAAYIKLGKRWQHAGAMHARRCEAIAIRHVECGTRPRARMQYRRAPDASACDSAARWCRQSQMSLSWEMRATDPATASSVQQR
jgi:hypothetical protein